MPLAALTQPSVPDEVAQGAQILLVHVVETVASVLYRYQHLDLILFQNLFQTYFLRLSYDSSLRMFISTFPFYSWPPCCGAPTWTAFSLPCMAWRRGSCSSCRTSSTSDRTYSLNTSSLLLLLVVFEIFLIHVCLGKRQVYPSVDGIARHTS